MKTSRRHFLRETATALTMFPGLRSQRVLAQLARPGNAVRIPPEWSGDLLTVERTRAAVWPGSTTEVQAINGSVPGPTIRVRRGEEFAARIQNQLDQPLVLHWHGLIAPERMDGHPRDQVGAGQTYDVRFRVLQRAATCWYHSHTDRLTAEQAYRGVAGLFLVEDPGESALGLPTGDHDIPLVLSDKRVSAQRQWVYAPSMMDQMSGYIGDVMLVNGTPDAWLSVDRGLYRFRLLNGSNARICKVGFVDGQPFRVLATDGGLLPAAVEVRSVMLAPGQRIEVLVDFSGSSIGTSLLLVSLPFAIGGGMMGGSGQGSAMDLIRFHVDSTTTGNAKVPAVLPPIEALSETQATRTRVFTLAMSGMVHTINGRLFDLERVEFTVPFGDVEIWEYRNTGTEPHPMHAHGGLGQVLSRSTAAVLPAEDRGWRDTVLVNPRETVRVLMRFDSHPGVFVHHCHNLEHEDSGMMQNFEVRMPPVLAIERDGGGVRMSWPESAEDWRLETSIKPVGSSWGPVAEVPVAVGRRWTVRIAEPMGQRFFRLVRG